MDDPQEGRTLGCIGRGLANGPKLGRRREPVRPPLDPDHPPLVRLVTQRVSERLYGMRLGDPISEPVQFRMDLDQWQRPASRQDRKTRTT